MTTSTQQSFLPSRLWFSLSKNQPHFTEPLVPVPSKINVLHILRLNALRIPSEDEQYCTKRSLYRSPWQAFLTAKISYGFTVHEKTDGISFRPVRKARSSLRGFSRNLQTLDSIMCRSVVPNFVTIEQRMCKLPTQLHSRPQSTAFTAPCNWPNYVEISYAEFHPKAANVQRQDVYRSMYAFNQTVPVSQSTESLLDFLKTLPAPNFTKI